MALADLAGRAGGPGRKRHTFEIEGNLARFGFQPRKGKESRVRNALALGAVDDDVRRSSPHSGFQSVTERRDRFVACLKFLRSSFGGSTKPDHRKRVLCPRTVTFFLASAMDQRPWHERFATRDERAGSLWSADLV